MNNQFRELGVIAAAATEKCPVAEARNANLGELLQERASLWNRQLEELNRRRSVLSTAMHDVRNEVEQSQAELAQEFTDLQQGKVELANISEIEKSRLEEALHAVRELVHAYGTRSAETQREFQEATESLTSVGNGLGQFFDQAADEFETQCEQACATLQVFEEGIKTAEVECARQAEACLQAVEQHQESLTMLCKIGVQSLQECEDAFTTTLDELSKVRLQEHVDGALGEVETATEDKLKELVDKAVAELKEMLDDLVEKITDSGKESASLRAEMRPMIDSLEGAIGPVKSLADQVQRMADRLTGGLGGMVGGLF